MINSFWGFPDPEYPAAQSHIHIETPIVIASPFSPQFMVPQFSYSQLVPKAEVCEQSQRLSPVGSSIVHSPVPQGFGSQGFLSQSLPLLGEIHSHMKWLPAFKHLPSARQGFGSQ